MCVFEYTIFIVYTILFQLSLPLEFVLVLVWFCTYVNTCKNNSISQTHFVNPLGS